MAKQDDRKTPVTVTVVGDFRGLFTNADQHDLPPGAAIQQVNATSVRQGELRARGGYQEVQFEA